MLFLELWKGIRVVAAGDKHNGVLVTRATTLEEEIYLYEIG